MLLAIPMVLELVLESVFAVVDVFFVSRLGPDAIATVGLTEAMMTLIYAVAMGLGMGATATVARRMGERDPRRRGARRRAGDRARPAGRRAGRRLLGFSFARPILALMGATPDVLAHSSFTAILFGFNGVILMLFLINAVFRGAGDAAIAMRVLWIANAINICLDPCFIFGLGPFPRLGVTGAAVATTTGRGIGVLVQLYFLSRSDGRIAIGRRHLRLDPTVMLSMLRLSGSAVLQMLIGTTSYIGVMRIIASFGSAAVAACTIVIRIIMFVLMPSWGLSNAAATLVGQNLGAKQPERAEASAWRACWFNVAVLGVLGVLFVVFAGRRRRLVHARSRGRADRDARAAHRQRRLPVLRGRLRADAVVQRRRRHADADADQPGLLLVFRDPAVVRARADARLRPARASSGRWRSRFR